MQLLALTLIGLIAAGVVVFVARPFLRSPQPRRAIPDKHYSSSMALLERRDRALAALKELEFEQRTGKLSESDYRALLGPLRREAAEILALMAQGRPRPVRPDPQPSKPSADDAASQHERAVLSSG